MYKTAISYVNSPKSYVQQSEKGFKTIKQQGKIFKDTVQIQL